MRISVLLGLLLFVPSAYPLFLMAREVAVSQYVTNKYRVVEVFDYDSARELPLETQFGRNIIRLEDDAPRSQDPSSRVTGPVRILINGRDHSHVADVMIRPAFNDSNRYWGYVFVQRLFERTSGLERLVVAQNIGAQQFRLVSVGHDGNVVDEVFLFEARAHPPVRKLLIAHVAGAIGYYSQVLQVWPTVVYPVIFPWSTGAVGAICLGVSLLGWWKSRVKVRPIPRWLV